MKPRNRGGIKIFFKGHDLSSADLEEPIIEPIREDEVNGKQVIYEYVLTSTEHPLNLAKLATLNRKSS